MFAHLGDHIGGSGEGNIQAIVRLLYRQFAHPTTSVSILAVISAAVGFLTLVVLSIFRKRTGNTQSDAILIALLAGFIVIIIGRFTISSLVTEIRYNLWIIPGLCIFLSSSLNTTFHFSKIIKLIAITLLIGANIYSASQFIIHGFYFSHSRFSSINKYIQKLGPENITIFHDGNAAVYFAIEYTYGSKINQFTIISEKNSHPILKKFPDFKKIADLSEIKTKYVMLLKTEPIGASIIADQIKNGEKSLNNSIFQTIIEKSKNWEYISNQIFVSYFQTDMNIYKNNQQ